MFFLPQGYKSGETLSGSGSTPMSSASLPELSPGCRRSEEPMHPARAEDWAALLHLHPRLCHPLCMQGDNQRNSCCFGCLSWSIDITNCINFASFSPSGRSDSCKRGAMCYIPPTSQHRLMWMKRKSQCSPDIKESLGSWAPICPHYHCSGTCPEQWPAPSPATWTAHWFMRVGRKRILWEVFLRINLYPGGRISKGSKWAVG